MSRTIPVILDTDIGGDIDDVWALAMLLRSPELDLKLVTTVGSSAEARAGIVGKLLAAAGRSGVPIGLGPEKVNAAMTHEQWGADYDLAAHAGGVHQDGIAAMIDAIMTSPQPITIIAIGPMSNLAAALDRQPAIAERCNVVAMSGSVFKGYDGQPEICAEYNVKADIPAAQKTFAAPWDITITPLDTCGIVKLTGAKYATVRDSQDKLARAVIENYRIWCDRPDQTEHDPSKASSILFDTVAVYLAFSRHLLDVRRIGLRIDDEGLMHVDQAGKAVDVAVDWRDMGAFEDLLAERLTTAN